MRERYLITTAIQETWQTDTSVLFLGEWCKRYSTKDKWQGLDYETVEYHWNDRQKLYNDYCYLNDFYEITLKKLTQNLNKYHKTNYSVRYWRIIIGPWLGEFIQICFDRWQMINKAVAEFDISGTTILEIDDSKITPKSMLHFMSICTEDEWNHYIYSQILQTIEPNININVQESYDQNKVSCDGKRTTTGNNSLLSNLKKRIRDFLEPLTNFLIKSSEYFLIDTFLSSIDLIKLEISLRIFPSHFRSRYRFQGGIPDSKERLKLKLTGSASTEFEKFLYDILPKQIPSVYWEDYCKLQNQVNRCAWPSLPKVIMTCTAHVHDDFFKAWAAIKTEEGTKLIIGQHASVYGSGKWFFYEDHELKICDKYFSWGWGQNNAQKIVPNSPARIINSKTKLKFDSKGGLLQVLTSLPRYSYHLYSSPVSSQMLSYEEDQLKFSRHLLDEIRSQLIVRPYIVDYGWDQKKRWNDEFPEVRIDNHQSFYTTMEHNRLLVGTANSTVFLESLSANIPIISFWDPTYWELRESAEPYYDLLVNVNILHTTPKSAAGFINETWDRVELWWNSYEVQKARSEFCEKFANSQEEWIKQWKKNLQNVAKH